MAKNTKNISNCSTKPQKITRDSIFPLASSNGKKVEVSFTLKKTSNDCGYLLLSKVKK